MDQVITFDKSLQCRLQEYEELFSGHERLPYSEIQKEWSYYLELTLDPNGWQAFWKIPRFKCEQLKITFPTVVLVYILNVSYQDLSALVRIIAVQDDIHLPEKHVVPLTQLWPTKQQDKSIALNLDSTANALDMLRFFYIHILRPWDEDDDSSDWKGAHLVNRLRLYYDMKNGTFPKTTTEHIYALLNTARRLDCKRQQLADNCDFDSDVENTDGKKELQLDNHLEELIQTNHRLIVIKNEVTLFENETFRKIILKNQAQRQVSNDCRSSNNQEKSHIWIICKDVTADEYIDLLNAVQEQYPTQSLSFALDLMSKLDPVNSNDTILLSPKKHLIQSEGALIENVNLKGIGPRDSIQVESLAEDVMFDCVGDYTTIENVSFDCKRTQCAILVRYGHVTLKNCKVIGCLSSTTHQGIVVLKGAKLSLESCEISGFSMAVIGNTESTIDISDSVISNTFFGVKVYDNCQAGLYRTCIKDSKEFGIILDTEKEFSMQQGSSFDALNVVPHIHIEGLTGSNNQKGDVIIKGFKIRALENLFENPDQDPTILGDSDEEMDSSHSSQAMNDTVFERVDREDVDVAF